MKDLQAEPQGSKCAKMADFESLLRLVDFDFT